MFIDFRLTNLPLSGTAAVARLSTLESVSGPDCVGGDEVETASTVGTSTHSV